MLSSAAQAEQQRSRSSPEPEQTELDAHRDHLTAEVKGLVEKYRPKVEGHVPEIDEALSDRLDLSAIRQVLDGVEKTSPDNLSWPQPKEPP